MNVLLLVLATFGTAVLVKSESEPRSIFDNAIQSTFSNYRSDCYYVTDLFCSTIGGPFCRRSKMIYAACARPKWYICRLSNRHKWSCNNRRQAVYNMMATRFCRMYQGSCNFYKLMQFVANRCDFFERHCLSGFYYRF